MSVYRKFIRHYSTYAVGTIARRFASFIMLPVFLRYFTPADYGVLELLDLLGIMVFYLIGSRMADGLLYFHAHADNDEEKRRVAQSALMAAHVLGFTGAFAGFLAAPWASTLMFGNTHYTYFMKLVFVNFAFTMPMEVGFGHLRAQNRSGTMTTLGVFRLFLTLVLNITLLYFHQGVASVLYSALISAALICFYMDFTILSRSMTFDWIIVKKIVRYSAPIALSAAGVTIIHSGDRFFLQRWATLGEVGLYALAYKVGSLAGYIQVPFETYWDAQVFHVVRERDGEKHFVRMLTYYTMALFGGGMVIALAAAPVLKIIGKPEYYSAAYIVPVVAFAYAIRGPADYFRSVFAIVKQPFRNAIVTGAGVAITLIAYATLIPRYRAWGAAIATAITFVGMGTVSYWQSRRAKVFHFEWRRFLQIILVSVGITAFTLFVRPANVFAELAVCVVAIAAYPVVLYLTGFFEASEVDSLRYYARQLLASGRVWRERAMAARQ